MTTRTLAPSPVASDELANTLTHAVGVLLSVFGVGALLLLTYQRGDAWQITGCSIYGLTVVMMYAVSTIYHYVTRADLKHTLRTIDHVWIYVFIAGSYTPFALVQLRGPWGWFILSAIWACALVGTLGKITALSDRSERFSVATYLVMGWFCLLTAKPIITHLPWGALLWLFLGGILYTAGVPFYVRDKHRYYHAIWHVFVLAGSCCHYVAVLLYVAPPA